MDHLPYPLTLPFHHQPYSPSIIFLFYLSIKYPIIFFPSPSPSSSITLTSFPIKPSFLSTNTSHTCCLPLITTPPILPLAASLPLSRNQFPSSPSILVFLPFDTLTLPTFHYLPSFLRCLNPFGTGTHFYHAFWV